MGWELGGVFGGWEVGDVPLIVMVFWRGMGGGSWNEMRCILDTRCRSRPDVFELRTVAEVGS